MSSRSFASCLHAGAPDSRRVRSGSPGREATVTKLLATIALGAASLGLVAQPAGAVAPTDTFAEVGAALEAHGITPCETADWSAKIDESDGPFYSVRNETGVSGWS
jgi:hypothetical protein